MKYQQSQTVEAIYDNAPIDNPFLAAMPDLMPRVEFFKAIGNAPTMPPNLQSLTSEDCRRHVPQLSTLFVPMVYMYNVYDTLYRAITSTYTTRTIKESIAQINGLFAGNSINDYASSATSGSILGVPGIGKTATIRRCMSLLPQVIAHETYLGKPFFCKQVLYLHIECPSDCSIKTLAFNLISALDKALGCSYMERLTNIKSASASAIATQVKILCMTHHVGLILIDEIQNAVVTARKNHQVRPLIKFLVELTNDTCTSIYFVGTPLAEELFAGEEHLKRRTRGLRLLPLKPDGIYREFLEGIWSYQYTKRQAPLTDKIANKLYDASGGVPAYIMKIFQEAQVQAILQGEPQITEKTVQRAIDLLAIQVPKTYGRGTYLSDFTLGVGEPSAPLEEEVKKDDAFEHRDAFASKHRETIEQNPKRLFANKRGRPFAQRDDDDLITCYKNGGDVLELLRQTGRLMEC